MLLHQKLEPSAPEKALRSFPFQRKGCALGGTTGVLNNHSKSFEHIHPVLLLESSPQLVNGEKRRKQMDRVRAQLHIVGKKLDTSSCLLSTSAHCLDHFGGMRLIRHMEWPGLPELSDHALLHHLLLLNVWNGWEWMGMGEWDYEKNGYYGSFPHSLLSTSQINLCSLFAS